MDIHEPNIEGPQYMRRRLTAVKGGAGSSAAAAEDCDPPADAGERTIQTES